MKAADPDTSGADPTTAGNPVASVPVDRLGRRLGDLRISVTDRCNLRCGYCMPRAAFGPGHRFLAHRELLTPTEIEELAAVFLDLGVDKIRLTGGEPLLRPELCDIVSSLSRLGVADLALTTNGILLDRLAQRLADSGLGRITVSLDTLDPDVFQRISDTRAPLRAVLRGIDAASAAGFAPIKLNCVVRRGVNEDHLEALLDYARDGGHIVRFIEFMDVGTTNGWSPEQTVSAAEIVRRIGERHPLVAVPARRPGEVARRFQSLDRPGEIGVISSVSQPFCGDCVRARLAADGRLYTCLFAGDGMDLAAPLRAGVTRAQLTTQIAGAWRRRDDRYSEQRSASVVPLPRIEMSYIGG